MSLEQHEHWMVRVIELAQKAKGQTSPNPLVGAVVLNAAGEVVGEGFHAKAGTDHAEVVALNKAGTAAEGGTIYVNLEPCSHYGRTPPCAKAIIEHKIKKVVVGNRDPNPKVNGQGLKLLQQAGLEVISGVLEDECTELNKFFFHWIKTGRPWVCLKVAASLNGKIANPQERWVTGPEARYKVHEMRAEYDAVLTGSGTVLSDDPELTVRLCKGRNPLRVILDRRLRCKPSHKLFVQPGTSWLFTSQADTAQSLNFPNTEVKPWDGNLENLLTNLGKENILSVLLETGTQLNSAFFKSGLVNEVAYFLNPSLYGTKTVSEVISSNESFSFHLKKFQQFGNDLLLHLTNEEFKS